MSDNMNISENSSRLENAPIELARYNILALVCALTGGGLGLLASFVLSLETLHLVQHPNSVLGCDINATLSCSTVANHWSAAVFGFPNSFIGMMTLPVVITIMVALLAGATFPRWFLRATWVGTIVGMIFAVWMFYASYVLIGALCPWCLTLDVGMLLIFFGTTRYMIQSGVIGSSRMRRWSRQGYDIMCTLSVFVLVLALIIIKFGASIL